ncbi:hypothetical protein VTO42DRAFT_3272 [Malbranchea cinnamomea]
MASPSSQSLVKRQSDTELMPPPPPPKRIKRPPKVLDEDDYTDALSHIIARDFFPGLLETQAQQEYLDALASKDQEWIANARRKLEEVMTPVPRGRRGVSMTPRMTPRGTGSSSGSGAASTPRDWAGDTPLSVASAASSSSTTTTARSKSVVPDINKLSLSAFQAKYTSEDNESFNKLLDNQNAKRREKYAWLWSGNKIPTPRQIAHRKREAKRLEAQKQIAKIDDGNGGKDSSKQLIISGSEDARPAKPDAWKSKPDNSLMFTPSSIEDTHETIQQRAEAASRAGPKQVLYHNTRLQPAQSSDAQSSPETSAPPPSPSISAIRDAIAGRPRLTDTDKGFAGGETPRVNGYAFVDEDEPEPEKRPSTEDDEAFHLRLLGSSIDSAPNPFKIRETRKREALHHRMVERVARNKRAEKIVQGTKTPVSRLTSTPMLGYGRTPGGSTPGPMLTPAAQRLLANVGTPRRTSGLDAGGNALKNMWTPTPKRAK